MLIIISELLDKIVSVTSRAAFSCHKFLGKNDKINAEKNNMQKTIKSLKKELKSKMVKIGKLEKKVEKLEILKMV